MVLIAEDEGVLAGVLRNKLSRHGFTVEVAEDGNVALEKMQSVKPALVLLDLIMPNKNGFQVLEEAKADAATKDIPIVVFSNLNQDEDRERAKKLGAKDFWVKSDIALNDVVGKINAIIGG